MKKNSLFAKILAGFLAFLMAASVLSLALIYFLQ